MINNGGPSGFSNAPVSRTFFIVSAGFTLLFRIRGRSNSLGLSYQDIFGRPHIWKYVVSIFAFSSIPEMLFGLYLLYYFRMFERQLGSNKYSVFILFSILSSSLFEFLYFAILRDTTTNITSGAYGLMFSLFVQFYFDIPVSRRFNIFGIHFSDKSFVYLSGLQLLLSSWRRSFFPGICGILAGALYRQNVLHIRKLKFPVFMTALFSRIFSPSTGASSAAPTRHAPSYTGRQVEFQSSHTTMDPPEDSIATLVSMGFDRNNARQALFHAQNDINAATNILLESQSN